MKKSKARKLLIGICLIMAISASIFVCGCEGLRGHVYPDDWVSDSAQHWHQCSCGEKTAVAAHEYDNACDTTCNVCCYERTVTHNYGEEWKTDGTQHWHECECGDKTEVAAHEYDNACDTTCNVCGYERTITHDYSAEWTTDNAQHWHACTVCGNKTAIANHTYNKAVVSDTYKASDATHHAKAKYYYSCECGAKGSETFENGELIPHDYSAEWTTDNAQHWHECTVCGNKTAIANHTYNKTVVSDTYKASDATHNAKAKYYYSCECGAKGSETFESGEVIPHDFGAEWKTNGTQHWKECSCGEKSAIADHEYTNACDTTCNVCGYERTITHDYSAEWTTDNAQHWHECTVCGNKTAIANHTYNKTVVSDTYKASDATHHAKAKYYYSCECGAKGSETFESGEVIPHAFGAEWTTNGT